MEENNKEEVKTEEFKPVKRNGGKGKKLSPAATVILTITAALGIIVLCAVMVAIFKVL